MPSRRRRLLPKEQRIIRRYLERHIGEIREVFLKACREQLGTIDVEQLARAVAQQEILPRIGQVYTYARVQTLIGTFEVNLEPLLRRLMGAAGELALPVFDEAMGFDSPTSLERFRARIPEDVRGIVAEEVTLIRRQARETIKEIVRSGFAQGQSPAQIARRIRAVVGLDARRAGALEKFATQLRANPGDLSPAEVEREIRREYRRKLKSRSETVGRTEGQKAAGETQRAIWRTAVDEGRLRVTRHVRVWLRVAGAQECPICSPLSGKRARLDGYYVAGGETYEGTPGHPNCICAEYLDDWAPGDELLPIRAG